MSSKERKRTFVSRFISACRPSFSWSDLLSAALRSDARRAVAANLGDDFVEIPLKLIQVQTPDDVGSNVISFPLGTGKNGIRDFRRQCSGRRFAFVPPYICLCDTRSSCFCHFQLLTCPS